MLYTDEVAQFDDRPMLRDWYARTWIHDQRQCSIQEAPVWYASQDNQRRVKTSWFLPMLQEPAVSFVDERGQDDMSKSLKILVRAGESYLDLSIRHERPIPDLELVFIISFDGCHLVLIG